MILETNANTKNRFTLHPTLSLKRIASKLPFTYTGADFYALCSDAMLKAVTRQASLVDSKLAAINSQNLAVGKAKLSTAYFFDHYATEQDTAVMVTEEDFENAERELVPSVSVKELEHYKRVRAQFEKPEEKKEPSVKGKVVVEKGIPDWQQQHEIRPKSNDKGKGRAMDRKGKGKERAWDVDEEEDEYYDSELNGVNKGKGKAVDMGFQPGTEDDDEGLY
jgi:peroxin-6